MGSRRDEPQPDWEEIVPPATGDPRALPQLPPMRPSPRPREQWTRSRWGDIEESIVRQNRALELKMAGATHTQIMEVLGYNTTAAVSMALQRALERDTGRIGEARDEFRRITVARTERLLRALWPTAISGDVGVIDRVLKIMERQARLLGLDAPTQITITDQTKSELSRLIGEVEKAIIPGEVAAFAAVEEVNDVDVAAGGARPAGRDQGADRGGGTGGAGGDAPDLRDWGLAAEGAAGDLGPLPLAGGPGEDLDDGDVAADGWPGDRED